MMSNMISNASQYGQSWISYACQSAKSTYQRLKNTSTKNKLIATATIATFSAIAYFASRPKATVLKHPVGHKKPLGNGRMTPVIAPGPKASTKTNPSIHEQFKLAISFKSVAHYDYVAVLFEIAKKDISTQTWVRLHIIVPIQVYLLNSGLN